MATSLLSPSTSLIGQGLPLPLPCGCGVGIGVGVAGSKKRRGAVKRNGLDFWLVDSSSSSSSRCSSSSNLVSWKSSWIVGPSSSDLESAASGSGASALLGTTGRRRRSSSAIALGGGEHLVDRRRFLQQHQHRLAASGSSASPSSSSSASSSSPSSSSGVDVTTKQEKPQKYGKDNRNWINFQRQQSTSSDGFAGGGWEGDDEDDGGFGHKGREDDSTGRFTELVDRENGALNGDLADNDRFQLSSEQESSSSSDPSSSSSSSSPSSPSSPSSSFSISSPSSSSLASGATSSVGSKEPVYEVIEVSQRGRASKKNVSRRQLLRSSGLRLRDLRRVDPSLWVTNSAPALLVRDQAILLNLGSLRAIATTQEVLIFDEKSIGAQAFLKTLVPRLSDQQNQNQLMPFEHEVIEAALITRTQRLERALNDVEPRVLKLLDILPTCMTADVLEELRLCKQELVEVGAKAGALRGMLLELLEHPQDIRRIVIMGRVCHVSPDGLAVECALPQDKQASEDEEEEMEMLLEYYLQRCESVHGQALKLLSSAKEMEESIGVNLSSRRLEVNKLELLLQVGTFCAALGALVAGIFGMNLKSYLEERALAFYFTTGGIIFGGIALFFYMFSYLSNRKIL